MTDYNSFIFDESIKILRLTHGVYPNSFTSLQELHLGLMRDCGIHVVPEPKVQFPDGVYEDEYYAVIYMEGKTENDVDKYNDFGVYGGYYDALLNGIKQAINILKDNPEMIKTKTIEYKHSRRG